MAINYLRTLDGAAPEIGMWTVGATAVKQGDPVKVGASANLVIPITASTDKIVGIALHDAAISATVAVLYATDMTVFRVPCSATKKYVASADKFTVADFDTFTSGSMSVDPAVATNSQVFLIDLYPGSPDNTNANVVQLIFNNRHLGK